MPLTRIQARDPLDLLVYGTGDLAQLGAAWCAAGADATLTLPEAFSLARHAGPLEATLVVAAETFVGRFELFVEPMSPVAEEVGGLEDVPPEVARRIRQASFCAVVSLSARASAASCRLGVFAALALARAADGVVADLEEDRYWLPGELLIDAERYLDEVAQIQRRSP